MKSLLLETPPLDACGQMALDEAVLDTAEPDAAYLRFYNWKDKSPHAVTFGYAQPYQEALTSAREKFGGAAMPVVRRLTGGGVVFHDGDLTFSFVFPWPRLYAASLIYKNIHLGAHLGLRARGVPSRLWSPGKPEPGRRAVCFAQPEVADIVLEGGGKCLGGALRRRKGMGLYQGSLRMEPFKLTTQRLREALIEGIGLQWKALWRPSEPDPKTAAKAVELRMKRYASDDWNQRR